MTKYLDRSFSVSVGSKAYRDGWEETFGGKGGDAAMAERMTQRLSSLMGSAHEVRITRQWFPELDDDGEETGEFYEVIAASVRCPRTRHEHALARRPEEFDEDMALECLRLSLLDESDVAVAAMIALSRG